MSLALAVVLVKELQGVRDLSRSRRKFQSPESVLPVLLWIEVETISSGLDLCVPEFLKVVVELQTPSLMNSLGCLEYPDLDWRWIPGRILC